jgi:hypothetical protein
MHFMLLLKGEAEANVPPSQELIDAMGGFNRELAEAGVLLAAEGLFHSSQGARVVTSGGGRKTVVDGPFTEAKELVAGFYLIDVKSREEAIEWARRCPVEKALAGAPAEVEAIVEVRQSTGNAEEAFPELAE